MPSAANGVPTSEDEGRGGRSAGDGWSELPAAGLSGVGSVCGLVAGSPCGALCAPGLLARPPPAPSSNVPGSIE